MPAAGGERVTAREPGTEARNGSKKATALALRRRPCGATLEDIVAPTEWQAHRVHQPRDRQ
ncbi:MAG: DUF3489 domain-containing protein [Bryobacteraceae bacterium]